MEKMEEFERVKFGKLLGDIGRLQASRLDRYLDQIGLFRGQAILLLILSEKDGLTHTEIAEKVRISPAAVTKVIKRLEELNYLKRQPDPVDERVSRVYMKEEGWAVSQHIRQIFRHSDQELLAIYTPKERELLIGLLTRMYAYLQKQISETES